MKTINFLKTALLTIALFVCGNAGAETITIIPNQATTGSNSSSYVTTEKGFTYTEVSYKINNWNPSELQIRGNKTTETNLQTGENFYFRNTTPIPGNITKIEIIGESGTLVANKIYLQTGTNEISNQSKGESTAGSDDGNNVTWNVSGVHTYFAIGMEKGGTSGNVYINSIVITYATAGTPNINCSAEELDFETIQNNGSKQLQFTISATDLTSNANLTINGEYFSCSPTSITPAEDGSIAETTINVTYNPTVAGSHTGTLTITSGDLTKEIALKGEAINPILSTPTATEATAITTNGFTANWNAVEHATTYEVNVWTSETFVPSGEKGTITNPYSFEEYINGNVSGTVSVYGYIVGYATSGDNYQTTGITSNTNIALAAAPGASQTFIPVELPKNSPLRDEWGLDSNPTHLNKLVIVTATKDEYFGNPNGLKSTSAISEFALSTETPIAGSPFIVTGSTNTAIINLAEETTYYYNVVAKAEGYTASEASNTISVTTTAEVAEPTITITGDDLVVETEGMYSVALGDTKFSTKTSKTFTLTATGILEPIKIKPEIMSGYFTIISSDSEQASIVEEMDFFGNVNKTLTFTPDETGEINAVCTISNRINSEFADYGVSNGEEMMQMFELTFGTPLTEQWGILYQNETTDIRKIITVSLTLTEESTGTGLCNQPVMEGISFNGQEIINSLNLDVVVYNAVGQMVVRSNENINMSSYPAGVYVIKAANGESMKIVK